MPTAVAVETGVCEVCCEDLERAELTQCRFCLDWVCADCECSCRDDDDDDDYDDDDDDGCCDDRVRAWNYRPPRFRPKGDYLSSPLLGVELEVGGVDSTIADAVQMIDDTEQHLYMKQDGSIDGVEIVTHPMTLAYAREYGFADLLARLRSASCFVNDGYGLHIHVSRNAFKRRGKQSQAHQMLWLLFIYRNAADVQALARRTSQRWAAFHPPAPGELARKARQPWPENRYVAVNCNNERTFELRFFASTLNEREFYAALEFAEASVVYTGSVALRDVLRGEAITWAHFTQWLRGSEYRQLAAELGLSDGSQFACAS